MGVGSHPVPSTPAANRRIGVSRDTHRDQRVELGRRQHDERRARHRRRTRHLRPGRGVPRVVLGAARGRQSRLPGVQDVWQLRRSGRTIRRPDGAGGARRARGAGGPRRVRRIRRLDEHVAAHADQQAARLADRPRARHPLARRRLGRAGLPLRPGRPRRHHRTGIATRRRSLDRPSAVFHHPARGASGRHEVPDRSTARPATSDPGRPRRDRSRADRAVDR